MPWEVFVDVIFKFMVVGVITYNVLSSLGNQENNELDDAFKLPLQAQRAADKQKKKAKVECSRSWCEIRRPSRPRLKVKH